MKEVQPAAKEAVQIEISEEESVLTQGLENLAWLLELDMEIPASAEVTHG